MKQFHLRYTDEKNFLSDLDQIKAFCENGNHKDVSFFITWNTDYTALLSKAVDGIEKIFPDAIYYGNECAGSISDSESFTGVSVLCTVLEDPSSKMEMLWVDMRTENGPKSLMDLWEICKQKKDLKAVEIIPSVVYVDTLHINNNVVDLPESIPVFGGTSFNSLNSMDISYIMAKGQQKTMEGMAVILYSGKNLNVEARQFHGWKGIGKRMTVTKCEGREVNEIDGLPAYSVYENYLNLSTGKDETYNHFNFPLLLDDENNEYIRIPLFVLPDKSMRFLVNMDNGSSVRIAYGEKQAILDTVKKNIIEMSKFEPQIIKMYNCGGRKYFWGDEDADKEVRLFKKLAPIGGSFTGTEILRINGKLKTLNATIVTASFREGEPTGEQKNVLDPEPEKMESLVSKLANFVGKMTASQEAQLAHEKMKADVMDYMINHDEDPIEILKNFAERLRSLFNCDQLIYRDTEGVRIMLNAPKFEKEWSIPTEYCKQCKHFDMNHPIYANGLTEMTDCKQGYKGIPSNHKCPVKSALTHIVYCDGKASGYLAIHYINNYHEFTEDERKTLKSFARILSISISRYKAKKENAELRLFEKIAEQKVKLEENAELINTLVSDYTSVYFVDVKNNKFVPCSMNDEDKQEFIHFFNEGISYEEALREFAEKAVYETDKEIVLKMGCLESLKQQLSKRKSITHTFRCHRYGQPYFCEIKFIKSDNEASPLSAFAIGIAEKDDEIIRHYATSELENEYISIFYINLNNNTYRTIRQNEDSNIIERNDKNWEKMMYNYSLACEPSHQKTVASIGDVNFLKAELANTNRREFLYRTPSPEQPWRRAVIKVVERKNGLPQAVIATFISIDDERSKTMDLEAKLLEQSAFLDGISHEFYIAWLIDESTKRMHTFQNSLKKREDLATYTLTDNQLYEDNARSYANSFVYKTDRERFLQETEFNLVKEKILQNKLYVVTFKHQEKNGGYTYHQAFFSKAKDNRNHLNYLIAFRNADSMIREQLNREAQLKLKSDQLDHERFRADAMSYLADFESKIEDFIMHFASRLLDLSKSDRLIYRDFDGVLVQKCAPGVDEINNSICKSCPLNDFKNVVYKNDGVDIPNTRTGSNGIQANIQCPAKSVYSKAIRLNNKIHGFFAIQYIKEQHTLTEYEQTIFDTFVQLTGIALNYIDSKKSKQILFEKNIQEIKKSRQIINNYTNEYDTVYIVNMEKDSFEVIKRDKEIFNYFDINSKFSDSIQQYIQHNVFPDDREMLARESLYQNIRKRLETQSSYSLEYRDSASIKNKIVWCDFSISTLSENKEILLAMRMNNEAIVKRLVDEKIHTEFASIFLVDIKNDSLTFISKAEDSGFKNHTDGKYTEIIHEYTQRIHNDYKSKWNDLCNLGKIKELLTKEKRIEYVYQLTGVKKQWRRCILQVLDEENGIPLTFIMTFMTIDNKSAAEFELNAQIAKQKEMLENQRVQLESALTMAQSASKAKTIFLNNMSHDIRTPMNAIIGYTGLASSHIENKEQVQDYLSKIKQSSTHLLSLINDVLDMSRIESGKMNLEEKNESLSDIIHTLKDIVQADIHSKHLDFFIDSADIRNEYIICDKLRLNQVLLNVLSNAIKYTQTNGTITMRIVETSVASNNYASYDFYIKDNGIGMDENFLKTIYDPFTRVKSSTVSGIQGTGLGMAITRNIVNMMGGSISINSESNKGTEVKITFNFKLQKDHKKKIHIPEFENAKCLVVDDDPNTCLSISDMLKEAGLKAEWSTSPKDAIAKVEESIKNKDLYKVFIVNWQVPYMDGIEIAHNIRKIVGKKAHIIILTSHDWSDVESEALKAGVTAFASKPLFPSDLNKVLNKCLGKDFEATKKKGPYNFKHKKILLVEDNDLNREIANEILKEAGFKVKNAKNGQEAVDIIKKASARDFDVILMDVQMPVMDGCEATHHIRTLGTKISTIPILAMTANAFEEDRKLVLDAGMNDHITKPIDINKLMATLAKYL